MPMMVGDICVKCLIDQQERLTDDKAHLEEVRRIIAERKEDDTAPYLVHLFNEAYKRRFKRTVSYSDIKRTYNEFVMSMEDALRKRIKEHEDPFFTSLIFARYGNFIDFGAMKDVDEERFLSLFDDTEPGENDRRTFMRFTGELETAKTFLLIADNSGEIVLDKLFIEQLKKRYKGIDVSVMVRGEETLNDATEEDAVYTGIDREAKVISNGNSVAGTVYGMLSPEARKVFDDADVILSKGQGNYETLLYIDRPVYHSFLCKCDLFMGKFNAERYTGMFLRNG